MVSEEISAYYDSTANSDVRSELVRATDLVVDRFDGVNLKAIDCGCGAGSDIDYLRSRDIEVFAFDIEREAIDRCCTRFDLDELVHLQQASFASYVYPKNHLVVADASLFFCPPEEFEVVWESIVESLDEGCVFVGSFLGERDTMASTDFDGDAFWPQVTTFTRDSLERCFAGFDIVDWVEHELDGKTAQGVEHHWHIFSVLAQKQPTGALPEKSLKAP